MNRVLNVYGSLILIVLLTTSCAAPAILPEPPKGDVTTLDLYQVVLGKSLTDTEVTEFLAANNCQAATPFQVCKEIGMALWVNPVQVIETVYLYLNNVPGFTPYKGELPYGLKFYDIMTAVEYKLQKQGVGSRGLPDQGSTPDHLHYWATYQEVGMIVVYNSPSASDEDATIYAILLNE